EVISQGTNPPSVGENGSGPLAGITGIPAHLLGGTGIVSDVLGSASHGGDLLGELSSKGPLVELELLKTSAGGAVSDPLALASHVLTDSLVNNGVLDSKGSIVDVAVLGHGGSETSSIGATLSPSFDPLIEVHAFGAGNGSGSHNLINADAGSNPANPVVVANLLGGPDTDKPGAIDTNIINTGSSGHTLANANVLTS